jgi:hypothetical protein
MMIIRCRLFKRQAVHNSSEFSIKDVMKDTLQICSDELIPSLFGFSTIVSFTISQSCSLQRCSCVPATLCLQHRLAAMNRGIPFIVVESLRSVFVKKLSSGYTEGSAPFHRM